MVLTPTQISEYRDRGFTIIPDFFDATEVALMQRELEALQAAGKLRNVATDGDGTTHSTTAMNLQVCPLSPHSTVFRSLPHAAKVRAVVAALIEGPAIHRLDQIFLKPARYGVGTNWHQDNGYFAESRGRDCVNGFGMWIAIHPANEYNGTMRLIPDAHERVLDHVRDGGSDHHVTCAAQIDEATAVPVVVPAGGVALFNYGVPHATGPNSSDHDRAGLALHFLKAGITPVPAHHNRGAPLDGPDSDGGRSLWGEDQRGRWERLVAEIHAASPG